ncbi:MAG: hypothetical protein HZB26_12400 [Candidatus Hydrogenedentes bacterium]|nr:hypothetical protein [Candidatus Hydrogenedentota bacterium]
MLTTRLGIIGLVCLFAAQGPKMALTAFPGTRDTLASPGGGQLLLNVDAENGQQAEALGNSHVLLLIDPARPSVLRIWQYGRSVDVAWSPDGSRILLNDHEGSNITSCHVLTVKPSADILNIEEENVGDLLKKQVKRESGRWAHEYIEGLGWTDKSDLRIKVVSYGPLDGQKEDGNGVERHYTYSSEKGFALAPSGSLSKK